MTALSIATTMADWHAKKIASKKRWNPRPRSKPKPGGGEDADAAPAKSGGSARGNKGNKDNANTHAGANSEGSTSKAKSITDVRKGVGGRLTAAAADQSPLGRGGRQKQPQQQQQQQSAGKQLTGADFSRRRLTDNSHRFRAGVRAFAVDEKRDAELLQAIDRAVADAVGNSSGGLAASQQRQQPRSHISHATGGVIGWTGEVDTAVPYDSIVAALKSCVRCASPPTEGWRLARGRVAFCCRWRAGCSCCVLASFCQGLTMRRAPRFSRRLSISTILDCAPRAAFFAQVQPLGNIRHER